MASRRVRSGRIVLGILVVAGLVFLGRTYSRYMILKTWPTVDAEVTSNRVRRHVVSAGRNHSDSTHFEVTVDFRYSAGGKELVSGWSEDFDSFKAAQDELATYAPGSRREIRYNPRDPNDIRFDAHRIFVEFIVFGGTGVIFTALGLTFLFVWLRKRTR
jgi:Protein of unknown function (DUF3592)